MNLNLKPETLNSKQIQNQNYKIQMNRLNPNKLMDLSFKDSFAIWILGLEFV